MATDPAIGWGHEAEALLDGQTHVSLDAWLTQSFEETQQVVSILTKVRGRASRGRDGGRDGGREGGREKGMAGEEGEEGVRGW